ncbi:Protein of unknown function [Bacillus mycoides]|jgi:hypothetical protein
MTN